MKRLMEKTVFCGIGDRLTLGDLADEPLAVLGEADDGRGRPTAFGVRDDDWVAAFHDGDDRVRRAQVDSNDFVCHCFLGMVENGATGSLSRTA